MDDRLRLLERAARADPSDRVAGRALVRALDQTGDMLGAWRARCRLARAGDPDVWRELQRRPAGPRELRDVTSVGLTGRPEVCDFGDDGLLLSDGDAAAVWDAVALTPRWSSPRASHAIGLVGPVAVLASHDRRTLAFRRVTDGEPIGETALPFACSWRLHSTAGYALAWADRTAEMRANRIATIDLVEAPGQVLDTRNESRAYTMHLTRGMRLVSGERRVVLRRVPDGRIRGRAVGFPLASDDEQVFTLEGEVSGNDWFVNATSLVGAPPWRRPFARGGVQLTDSTLVQVREPADAPPWGERRTAETLDVVALDRRTGEPRWHLQDRVGTHLLIDVAAARDVVVLAYGPPVGPQTLGGWPLVDLTLRGVDAASGETLWVREVGPAQRTGRHGLCLVDRGVLMLVEPDRRLIRLSG